MPSPQPRKTQLTIPAFLTAERTCLLEWLTQIDIRAALYTDRVCSAPPAHASPPPPPPDLVPMGAGAAGT